MKGPTYKSTITITYGDAGENHVGMQMLGKKLDKGFTCEELKELHEVFSAEGDYESTLVDLEFYLPEHLRTLETKGASILIVRDALPIFGLQHDATFETLKNLHWDSKFWSQKHGRVVNKNARWNFCVGDFSQVADLDNKKGTVHDFKDVPCLNRIREDLSLFLGERIKKFIAEGNYYYDAGSCGIGAHGDKERRCVIALRFGKEMPLCYQWYQQSGKVGEKVTLNIRGGDMYIMSEKAVGTDWQKKLIPTLRHAAGCDKYTK